MSIPFEAAVAELVRRGFPRDVAEREVNRQIRPVLSTGLGPKPGQVVALTQLITSAPLPFLIALPWSHLVSDDDRVTPWLNPKTGKATIILTDRYKAARDSIHSLLRQAMGGSHNEAPTFAPLAQPLRLEARVFVPNNQHRDVHNFAKGVHDALERKVYQNDSWLHDTRWIRAGVDVDRPRAEITITPL